MTRWIFLGMIALLGLVQVAPAHAENPQMVNYADLVEKLNPSVVNISTKTKPKKVSAEDFAQQFGQQFGPNPFEGTPFEEFFQEFNRGFGQGFGGNIMTTPQQSLGSGVVISPDGYVVTNNHVVEGADEIVVKFNNNRHEFPAKLIGRDEKTDLALLKITATKPLPYATLGDSDKTRVGEAVLAIGNPFSLGGTVTSGIVSALGRNIGQGPYDDFIQTDAAINPGNSGGPLFNASGQVIGINSAIFTRSGASNGIGFAIPVNTVKTVVEQLKTTGKVVRAWLGVKVQLITPDLAESLGLKDDVGALVAEVSPGSPAARGGLKTGDVIVQFGGRSIVKMDDLPKLVAATPIGTKVPLSVVRDGQPVVLNLTLVEMPDDDAEELPGEETTRRQDSNSQVGGKTGLGVQLLTAQLRASLGLPAEVTGLVVARVEAGSAADAAGLQRGDVLVEADRKRLTSPAELRSLLAAKAGRTVLLRVFRGGDDGGYSFASLKVAK